MTVANEAVYFVDTNIVMYAVGATHALKQPCLQIFADCQRFPLTLTTSSEVLQELLHVYTARGQRATAIEICRDFMTTVDQILPVTENDFTWALHFHQQYNSLPARDSVHAATMINNGLTYILSADKHFDGLAGITRVDPTGWAAHLKALGMS
ncbi:MAG: type II toxin-antitoxin system VapC family toxin [Caldilineaceae bacterium]